jgi:hypothetical protein
MTACGYIVRYPAGTSYDKIKSDDASMECLLCVPVLLCLTCDDLYLYEKLLLCAVYLYALTHTLHH